VRARAFALQQIAIDKWENLSTAKGMKFLIDLACYGSILVLGLQYQAVSIWRSCLCSQAPNTQHQFSLRPLRKSFWAIAIPELVLSRRNFLAPGLKPKFCMTLTRP
jgi:hypothetical protein